MNNYQITIKNLEGFLMVHSSIFFYLQESTLDQLFYFVRTVFPISTVKKWGRMKDVGSDVCLLVLQFQQLLEDKYK